MLYDFLDQKIGLVCPLCKGGLDEEAHCETCGVVFPEKNGVRRLARPELIEKSLKDEKANADNRIKNFFKKWPRLYQTLTLIIAPVLFSGLSAKKLLQRMSATGIALNIGSGPTDIHPRALNVDLFPFPNVRILAGADALPFADNSFDMVCSEQVLEHLSYPQKTASEMVRVAKPGGLIYVAVPFLFPYHPSPKDYSRFSIDALRALFSDCEEMEAGILCGPVSGMLVTMASGLSVIFSFGIVPLGKGLNYLFMILLSPFKILDYLYARLPQADITAAGVYIVLRKK